MKNIGFSIVDEEKKTLKGISVKIMYNHMSMFGTTNEYGQKWFDVEKLPITVKYYINDKELAEYKEEYESISGSYTFTEENERVFITLKKKVEEEEEEAPLPDEVPEEKKYHASITITCS
jgi:hypothetical protein